MLAESREAFENVRTCCVAMVEVCDSALEVLRLSCVNRDVGMPKAAAFATSSSSTSASDRCDDSRSTWARYSASPSSGVVMRGGGRAMSVDELVWPASEPMAGRGVGKEEIVKSGQRKQRHRGSGLGVVDSSPDLAGRSSRRRWYD